MEVLHSTASSDPDKALHVWALAETELFSKGDGWWKASERRPERRGLCSSCCRISSGQRDPEQQLGLEGWLKQEPQKAHLPAGRKNRTLRWRSFISVLTRWEERNSEKNRKWECVWSTTQVLRGTSLFSQRFREKQNPARRGKCRFPCVESENAN